MIGLSSTTDGIFYIVISNCCGSIGPILSSFVEGIVIDELACNKSGNGDLGKLS